MTEYRCSFCDNESRIICTDCKKDVCKDHAVYQYRSVGDDDREGQWVCVDCANKYTTTSCVWSLIALIIFAIIVAIVVPILLKNFGGGSMFP